MLDTKDPRTKGRKAVEDTVEPGVWQENRKFAESLKATLAKHPIASHPLMDYFDNETISTDKSLAIHLEFGYGFAQIFTDAVIQAMSIAKSMEQRLGPRGKVAARFLWAINLMDEIGYVPSGNTEEYAGNPYMAHYFQYVDMFKKLGAESEKAINDHVPTDEAVLARKTFEDQYDSYADLASVLALSESIFDKFAGPWARNTEKSTAVDTSAGYHTIHVEDDHGESIDDEHSEDGWTLFCQAVTPEDHARIEGKVKEWLDIWYKFADKMLDIAMA